MVAARANWRGYLTLGELSCSVGLYTAASTSDRVSFHIINRKTGNRVQRQMVDSETGDEVERDEIVKGYEMANGDYVVLDPEEIKSVVPDSDKTLAMETFIPCSDINTLYLDRPYYLAPSDETAAEVFSLIRQGLEAKGVAALARTVLFRRLRTLLIRPHDDGLIAATLNYEYEVRSADEVFDTIDDIKIEGEMLDLAQHIIDTKRGRFDPAAFDDRYETALQELVKAKIEGRKIKKPAPPKETNVTSLMEALRLSVGGDGSATKSTGKGNSSKETGGKAAGKSKAKAKASAGKAKAASSKAKATGSSRKSATAGSSASARKKAS
ncbi:Ku protein [Rhizobium sp. SSA_523]|uniref:non-homologous end joining protein Ku n=1 Tax=Rhizobium sp. SSA_523 TaxID=2952477 RepID=UPI002091043E|nr:Ku protein [Rhizobium sp. SSA_523]MCO5731745.1 Ku protein [Rhizobium sp. SSA_523]WKC25727.1 Ku protein [Rhizobium sp. SSA_523]